MTSWGKSHYNIHFRCGAVDGFTAPEPMLLTAEEARGKIDELRSKVAAIITARQRDQSADPLVIYYRTSDGQLFGSLDPASTRIDEVVVPCDYINANPVRITLKELK